MTISDIDGISGQQPKQPIELIEEMRSSHCGDGIDGRVDGSLESETVAVRLEHTEQYMVFRVTAPINQHNPKPFRSRIQGP